MYAVCTMTIVLIRESSCLGGTAMLQEVVSGIVCQHVCTYGASSPQVGIEGSSPCTQYVVCHHHQ